jgi:predicted secreted protein
MPIATAMAVYFIFWWLTLFTMLPIGLRTQADEDDVTLGTTPSAPHKHRMGRIFLWTTIVSAVIFAGFYVINEKLGYGVNDLPVFFPQLD